MVQKHCDKMDDELDCVIPAEVRYTILLFFAKPIIMKFRNEVEQERSIGISPIFRTWNHMCRLLLNEYSMDYEEHTVSSLHWSKAPNTVRSGDFKDLRWDENDVFHFTVQSRDDHSMLSVHHPHYPGNGRSESDLDLPNSIDHRQSRNREATHGNDTETL